MISTINNLYKFLINIGIGRTVIRAVIYFSVFFLLASNFYSSKIKNELKEYSDSKVMSASSFLYGNIDLKGEILKQFEKFDKDIGDLKKTDIRTILDKCENREYALTPELYIKSGISEHCEKFKDAILEFEHVGDK